MATYKKLESGRWQAQVAKQGIRRAASFKTKREAQDWAARQEFLIGEGQGGGSNQTLAELFGRYAREVSPKKRGGRWEIVRLALLEKDRIGAIKLSALTPADLADWRDRRLAEVQAASVTREMGLISAVLTRARKEWGLIKASPMSDVRRPAKAQPRDRRVWPVEIEKLLAAAGDLRTVKGRAVHAFRFAIETGMRAGEITGLRAEDVDLSRRVARLAMTKNGTERGVPLSLAAIALLQALPATDGPLFNLTARQADTGFRKARDKAGIKDLHFHDSRHEAITRLAKKLHVLDLARVVGIRDIRVLMVYYNETPEELALRLD